MAIVRIRRGGTKTMRDILTVRVSDSGTELFLYDGNDNLVCVKAVSDPAGILDYAAGEIEGFLSSEGN